MQPSSEEITQLVQSLQPVHGLERQEGGSDTHSKLFWSFRVLGFFVKGRQGAGGGGWMRIGHNSAQVSGIWILCIVVHLHLDTFGYFAV